MTAAAMPLPAPRWALPALILGAIAIGFSPLFVRLSDVGPTATAFWRLTLALPLFYAWTLAAERRAPVAPAPLSRAAKLRLLILGLLFTGDLFSWHWSIHLTTVANSTLFANFAPIFVVFGAWAFFGDKPKPVFLAGLAFTFIGAGCLIANSFSIGTEHALGDGLGIVTAFFFGSYILVVKDLRASVDAPRLMLWSSLVTALALLPLALITEGRIFPDNATGWLVLIALAWVSQAAGQGLIAEAVGHLPAGLSSLVILVEPLAAAILGWIVLGEALGPIELAGGVLILTGIMIARRGT